MNEFEAQASYTKEFPDGTLKRVKEWYLLTAPVSFTDAETLMYSEVAEGIRGEFAIHQIKKADYTDIFAYDGCDHFYKCKLAYKTENADTGKETKVVTNYLVQADNVDQATKRLHESMKGLMVTYEIESVSKTPIVEMITSKIVERKSAEV